MYSLFKSASLGRSSSLQGSNGSRSNRKQRWSLNPSFFSESLSSEESQDLSSSRSSSSVNVSDRSRHFMLTDDPDTDSALLSPNSSTSSSSSPSSSFTTPSHRAVSSMDDYFSFPSLEPVLPEEQTTKSKNILDFWMIKGGNPGSDTSDRAELEMEPYAEIILNGMRL